MATSIIVVPNRADVGSFPLRSIRPMTISACERSCDGNQRRKLNAVALFNVMGKFAAQVVRFAQANGGDVAAQRY